MTGLRYPIRAALWALIVMGLWSASRLSWATLTGVAPCPAAAGIPICYAVTLGYLGMLGAQLQTQWHSGPWLFYPAWAVVALIALSGTGAELIFGDVCPKSSSGTPMCFFSLAYCALILVLHLADRALAGRGIAAP